MTRELDRYRPQEELGRGEWGVVHRARDPLTNEELALKVCLRRGADDLQRLKQEFRCVRSLRHPNLVRLFELVIDDDIAFFTMELVPGYDLQQVTERLPARGTLDHEQAVVSIVRQLADAVMFLHEQDVLHRDLKPSNVRVTPEGRVVLLDFGLSASSSRSLDEQGTLIGSFEHMAPECMFGGAHTKASDAFGVGMLIWRLLTDLEPFPISSVMANLGAKRRGSPSLPDERGSPLAMLAAQLLAPEPGDRPLLAQALEQLGVSHSRATVPFVGRREQLVSLRDACEREEGSIVHVHGPPGIGKTRLVQEAIRGHATLDVIAARCHPDEAVPYRAVDGLMDELFHLLWRLPAGTTSSLAPELRHCLAEVFPTLASIPGWEPPGSAPIADARERRRIAARGFAELVVVVARATRIALWIDDLQWGDVDSEPFLVELLRTRPPALVVLSYRWPEPEAPLVKAARAHSGTWDDVAVPPLDAEECTTLAGALGRAQAVSAVASEGGNPGWVEEVVRLGVSGSTPGSLDEAVRRRANEMTEAQRTLLELVMLDHPIEAEVLLRAAAAPMARWTLDELEATRWIRRTSAGLVDAWHDRIPDALVPELTSERRVAGHRSLAAVLLDTPDPRPRRVARHLEGAERGSEAVTWYERAAVEARVQLAFDRAAQDYEAALRLNEDRPWPRLHALAEVLDLAGRSARAGETYLEAAERRPERGDAQHRELRLLAGTRLLYGGRLEEGRAVLEAILATAGVRVPKRPLRAGLTERLRLVIRGTRFEPVPEVPMSSPSLDRTRALIDTAGALFMVAPVLADALAVRGLREAVGLGNAELVIAALGFECSSEANIGGPWLRRRAARLFLQLQVLAEQTGDVKHRATAQLTEGSVAFFENRWEDAVRCCSTAYRRFLAEVPGSAHYQNAAMAFHVGALGASGRVPELRAAIEEYRRAAETRGDRYADVAMATGETFLPDLADDEPERALARAERAMAAWPARDFSSPHYQHAFLEVSCLHYQARHREAWERLEAVWPELRRHGFLGLEWLGHQLRYLRGRVALTCAKEAVEEKQRRAWEREARRATREMRASKLPAVVAFRLALERGLAGSTGGDEVAAAFERASMPMYAAAARGLPSIAAGIEPASPARFRAFLLP